MSFDLPVFSTALAGMVRRDVQDMTLRQLSTLLDIAASPGRSCLDVAKSLEMSKPSVTRACDKMVSIGWINRVTSADDRRRVSLTVTKAGKAFVAGIGRA